LAAEIIVRGKLSGYKMTDRSVGDFLEFLSKKGHSDISSSGLAPGKASITFSKRGKK